MSSKRRASKGAEVSEAAEKAAADSEAMPPPPKKARGEKKAKPGDSDDLDLYSLVLKGSSSDAYEAWRRVLARSSRQALRVLLNFALASAGCGEQLSPKQLDTVLKADADTPALMAQLAESHGERNVYPLVDKSRQHRQFRAQLPAFWRALVRELGAALFDADKAELRDTLAAFLVAQSQSMARAFRHTATVACMALHSALVELHVLLRAQIAAHARSLSAERRKASADSARVAELSRLHDALKDAQADCAALLGELYESVFLHRYKDVDPQVRSETLEALAQWALADPERYATDVHTRHLGWSLSDRADSVRVSAVRALTALYGSETASAQLERFTGAFRARMVQLLEDRAVTVVVAAYALLGVLAQQQRLEPEHVDAAQLLVSDADERIRAAAASFVRVQILEGTVAATLSASRKGKRAVSESDVHVSQLRELVKLVQRTAAQPSHVAQALKECACTRDWESYTTLLSAATTLDDAELAVLAQLMQAAAAHVDRDDEAAVLALTVSVSGALPALLDACASVPAALAPLALLPVSFALDVFSVQEREEALSAVLAALVALLERTQDARLLAALAQSLSALVSRSHAQQRECSEAVAALVGALVERLNALSRQLRLNEAANAKAQAELSAVLARVAALAHRLDVAALSGARHSAWTQDLLRLLQFEEDGGSLSASSLTSLADAAALSLMWHRAHLGSDASRSDQTALATSTSATIAQMERLLALEGDAYVHVRAQAFTALSDLLVLFSPALRGTALSELAYNAPPSLIDAIWTYFHSEMSSLPESEESEDGDEDASVSPSSARAASLIASAGKLALFECAGALRESSAHVLRYAAVHASLVKPFHDRLRAIEPDYSAVFNALRDAHVADTERAEQEEDAPRGLPALVKRIAASYGLARQRSEALRSSLVQLCAKTIEYAAANALTRQSFLLATEPLIHRLDDAVAVRVLDYFHTKMTGLDFNDADYSALADYRASLHVIAKQPLDEATAKRAAASARLSQAQAESSAAGAPLEEEAANTRKGKGGRRGRSASLQSAQAEEERPQKRAKASSTAPLANKSKSKGKGKRVAEEAAEMSDERSKRARKDDEQSASKEPQEDEDEDKQEKEQDEQDNEEGEAMDVDEPQDEPEEEPRTSRRRSTRNR